MSTIAVALSFLFLCSLLIWLLIAARGRWWLKLAAILLTALVSFGIWRSLESYFGHPRTTTIGEMSGHQAVLWWARVEEPSDNNAGSIELWMRVLNQTKPGPLAYNVLGPSLYRFPYDRDSHQAIQQFITKILAADGAPIQIAFFKAPDNPRGRIGGSSFGDHGEKVDGRGSMSNGQGVMYQLPDPKLPDKPN